MIQPGQAPGTARLALGYGRTAAGAIGGDVAAGVAPVGVDAYKLRTTKLWDFGAGATLAKVGSGYPLATMQDTHSIDAIGQAEIQRRVPRLVREGTHEEKCGEFADVIAWLVTLANINDVNLTEALQAKYGTGCPGCGKRVCSCDSKS